MFSICLVTELEQLNTFRLPFGSADNDYVVTVHINCYDSYGSFSTLKLEAKVVQPDKSMQEV